MYNCAMEYYEVVKNGTLEKYLKMWGNDENANGEIQDTQFYIQYNLITVKYILMYGEKTRRR